MVEDPIKLFATRAERYPEPSEVDTAQAIARAGIAAIPTLGGPINQILSLVLAPAVARRRDEWFKELAEGLDQLESKFESFKAESLAGDEVFVSAVIQATRTAAATHHAEKRTALRNALLNVALKHAPEEDELHMFLRYIDELTIWHIRFLQLFQEPTQFLTSIGVRFNVVGGFGSRNPNERVFNYTMGGPSAVLELAYPELKGKSQFYDQIAADLSARGMLNSSKDFLHTTMSANGMLGKRTTETADAFLALIKNPL